MNNFSESIRNSADIVKVVSEYVALKGSGSTLKGLCPFHSEKTPSFSVHREKQVFYCFGCHAGGDVIEFVKLAEQVAFPEALRIVAEKCGLPVPPERGWSNKQFEERQDLYGYNDRAAAYFQEALSSEEAILARRMLEKRKIAPAFVKRFSLGYAPDAGLLNALKPKDPVSTGLFLRNDRGDIYDRFRHRLMFPIWNDRGKIIAFGGRALGNVEPKYLNSPETQLYSKSHVLYALHLAREAARKADRFVVVEGYFDCLSLHQNGFENVVASCGTSLTPSQVDLMARYVPEVVMNYDPDAAGQNAMRRSIDLLLAKGLRIRILNLPGGLDPDDFVREEGRDVYSKLLAEAPYFWQYLTSEAMRNFDLSDPAMKGDAVKDVLQFVSKIQDRVERLEVAKAVAEAFKVPESVIYEQLQMTAGRPEVRPMAKTTKLPSKQLLTESEKLLIFGVVHNRQLGEGIVPYLEEAFLTRIWSFPVLSKLINKDLSLEDVLGPLEDNELRSQVRALLFESRATVSGREIEDCIQQLRCSWLVKQEEEIRDQLKTGVNDASTRELLERLTQIGMEKYKLGQLWRSRA